MNPGDEKRVESARAINHSRAYLLEDFLNELPTVGLHFQKLQLKQSRFVSFSCEATSAEGCFQADALQRRANPHHNSQFRAHQNDRSF
jgi:hypothetical protein